MYSALLFFFSSRRRHTRCSRDWSSDVCSSDLLHSHALLPTRRPQFQPLVTNERAWTFASRGKIRVVRTGYHWDQRLGASAVADTFWALARACWTFSRVWRT